MPNQQAVTQLATAIKDAFNAMLPEASTPEMVDVLADITVKNEALAGTIAAAINTFIKTSTVTIDIPWMPMYNLLQNKLKPYIYLMNADIDYCIANPTQHHKLENNSSVGLEVSGGITSITLTKANAIS